MISISVTTSKPFQREFHSTFLKTVWYLSKAKEKINNFQKKIIICQRFIYVHVYPFSPRILFSIYFFSLQRLLYSHEKCKIWLFWLTLSILHASVMYNPCLSNSDSSVIILFLSFRRIYLQWKTIRIVLNVHTVWYFFSNKFPLKTIIFSK